MFYGSEHSDLKPTNREYAFVESLGNLYRLLLGCWRRDTCAPRMQEKWSESNPTCGQCSITAFLVQDIFGGKVYGVPNGDGNYHCFNVVGDAVFDLTSEQFDHPLAYTMDFPQSRETHFAKTEKKLRYESLKVALMKCHDNDADKTLATRTRFTQVSLFSVLLSGRYDGVITIGELKKLGNMAIATMDRLDGEMQMIDGVVYQACADGHVYLPTDDATIPFGTIAEFAPKHTLNLSDIPSYETFEARIDELCPEENIPLAIHFIGDFRHMKVRTVARQERDGVGLADAAQNEAVFECLDVHGDLVGFRLPGYVKGVNAPGWHLHFVDAERRHGGHVVNFSLRRGELRCCYADDFQIRLPDAGTLAGLNLARDWSEELKRAEAER